MAPKSAILYQNDLGTVTLLDTPTSLARAQGCESGCTCTREILSAPPIQAPYPSIEPKSDRARMRVMQRNQTGSSSGEFPTELLAAALEEVAAARGPERWCLERRTRDGVSIGTASEEVGMGRPNRQGTVTGSVEVTSELALAEPVLACDQAKGWQALETVDLSSSPSAALPYRSIINRLMYNPSPQHVSISIDSDTKTYFLPPKSGFILSEINASSSPVLSMAAYSQLQNETATAGPGQFDFILLDPPWPNRSVRRSRAYKTEQDPMEALQPVLGQHMAPNALVACWITNKADAREIATEAFESWDVELLEEWAWLKVTTNGKLVTELEGLWRRPYEILLVGRKRLEENVFGDTQNRIKQFKVIIAVPDVHSRKPHLKEMIEPMMTNPKEYRALEIFGRNLTAGWWTYGDEALRFNWSNWWIPQDLCQCRSGGSPYEDNVDISAMKSDIQSQL